MALKRKWMQNRPACMRQSWQQNTYKREQQRKNITRKIRQNKVGEKQNVLMAEFMSDSHIENDMKIEEKRPNNLLQKYEDIAARKI